MGWASNAAVNWLAKVHKPAISAIQSAALLHTKGENNNKAVQWWPTTDSPHHWFPTPLILHTTDSLHHWFPTPLIPYTTDSPHHWFPTQKKGYLFHFTQAIWRKLQSLGFQLTLALVTGYLFSEHCHCNMYLDHTYILLDKTEIEIRWGGYEL